MTEKIKNVINYNNNRKSSNETLLMKKTKRKENSKDLNNDNLLDIINDEKSIISNPEIKKQMNNEEINIVDYIKILPEMNENRRFILLEWIMGICHCNYYTRTTFHLTIQLIDDYLSTIKNLSKEEIQLIGASCLFLACKYNEVYIPSIDSILKFTGNSYTKEQILKCEIKIMTSLKWMIVPSNIYEWANFILNIWKLYTNENNDFCIDGNFYDVNIDSVYFYIIDKIALDYYHRFKKNILLSTCTLFIINSIYLNIINENNYLKCINDDKYFEKCHFNEYFCHFIDKYNYLMLKGYDIYFSYILKLIDIDLIKCIKVRCINSKGKI